MNCPICGSKLAPGAQRCDVCGAPVAPEPSAADASAADRTAAQTAEAGIPAQNAAPAAPNSFTGTDSAAGAQPAQNAGTYGAQPVQNAGSYGTQSGAQPAQNAGTYGTQPGAQPVQNAGSYGTQPGGAAQPGYAPNAQAYAAQQGYGIPQPGAAQQSGYDPNMQPGYDPNAQAYAAQQGYGAQQPYYGAPGQPYGAQGPQYGPQGAPYGYAPGQPAPQYAPVPAGTEYSAYYAQQFAQIAQTGKGGFNVAAFFLGAFQLLYRGCTKRFLAAYLPLYVFSVLTTAGTYLTMFRTGSSTVSAGLMALSWVSSMASLGVSIWNGVTFNRYYCTRMQGSPFVEKHTGRVWILAGVMMLVWTALMAVFVVSGFSTRISDYGTDDSTYGYFADSGDSSTAGNGFAGGSFANGAAGALAQRYSDAPASGATEYYGAKLAQIFADYGGSYDQSLVNGCSMSDSWQTDDVLSILNEGYLFYSDEITLRQLMQNALDGFEWQDVTEDASGDYSDYTVRMTLDDTVVQMTCRVTNGVFWATDASAYLQENAADSTKAYTMSGDELCALLQAMYDVYPQQDTYSISRTVRGTWNAQDGSQLVLTEATWNGSDYTLWYRDGDTLALYLDGSEDASGNYYLTLSADGNTLTVKQEGTSDNSDSSALEVLNTYTRAA